MQKGNQKRMSKTTVAFLLFCTVVPVISFFVFYVWPNFSAFTMAFTNSSGEPSFDNFTRFFDEITSQGTPLYEALINTLIVFGIQLVTFPMKVLVSYFIYKKIPLANVYRVLFFLPSIIFSVAVAFVFQRMVGVNGFIAEFVQNIMGLEYTPELLADSRFANYTIWFKMLWLQFPGDLIIWGGTFARIPVDVLESARVDGVTWWTEFTQIIVPLVWPTVALKMVLMTCGLFGATAGEWLLTSGEYGTMTFTSWIYNTMYRGAGGSYRSNMFNYLSAVGTLMTVISVSMAVIVRKITDKVFDEVDF